MIDVALRLGLKGGTEVERGLKAIGNEGKTSLREIREAARGLPAPMVAVSRSVAGLKDGIENLARSAPAGLGNIASSFGMLGVAAAAAGVLVGTAVVATFRLGRAALQAADDLDAAATRIGVTAESLQEYRFAANDADIATEDFDKSLQGLNNALGAYKTGVGDARVKKAFEALGLTPADLAGVANAVDFIPILADRIAKLQTTAERVKIAKALGAEEMVPMLELGSDAILEQTQRARDLGIVMSDQLAKDAADANRELEVMWNIITSKTNVALADMGVWAVRTAQDLKPLIDRLAEFLQLSKGSREAYLRQEIALAEQSARLRATSVNPALRGQAQGYLDRAAQLRGELAALQRPASTTPQPAARASGDAPDAPPPPRTRGSRSGRATADAAARKAELAERQAKLLEEIRLQNQLEQAKARGAQHLIDLLEEQLAIRALANRYEQAGLDEVNARLEAEKEIAALRWAQSIKVIDTATPEGFESSEERMKKLGSPFEPDWDQLREDFRVSFKDGIRAALDGDFGDFLASRVEEAFIKGLDDSIDKMADALFDMLREVWATAPGSAGAPGTGGSGGGWLAAAADFAIAVFGGGSGSGASAHIGQGRATGGPVYRGDTRMVGEYGPERRTFGADAYIHDAATTARQLMDSRPAPGAAGGGGGAAGPLTVNVNNQSGVAVGARVNQTPEPGGGQRLDLELYRMIDSRIEGRFDASLKGGRDDQVRAQQFGMRRNLRGG